MELRPATREEFDDFGRAALSAFHQELTDADRERYARIDEPERSLAWFDDGRIVATTGVYTREVTVPGAVVPCAAVTAVAVVPTHRRRGLLTAMMRRQLEDLRDRGDPVAILWASEGGIYGRFGYGIAARGLDVVALDSEAALLAALEHRASGLTVTTLVADARSFELRRRFALIVVPMQTLQLFGGPRGRAAFLQRAYEHLEPGGLLAAAVADAMDCFDDEHDAPPPPDARDIAGVRYASRLRAGLDDAGRAAIHRRREVIGANRRAEDVVIRLDRVSADEVTAEAARLGFLAEPHRLVPETEQYLGSTIVVARKP
jgi:predicted N-acetyltransferase YhbS